MEQCVIRVLGDQFDPKQFLSTSTLTPSAVFRKGEVRLGRLKPATTSGFTCDVGAGELEEQVCLASDFMRQHFADLRRVSMTRTVESFFLDFAYSSRLNDNTVIVQRDFLPADFIRLAGEVGIGICLTLCEPVHGEAEGSEADAI